MSHSKIIFKSVHSIYRSYLLNSRFLANSIAIASTSSTSTLATSKGLLATGLVIVFEAAVVAFVVLDLVPDIKECKATSCWSRSSVISFITRIFPFPTRYEIIFVNSKKKKNVGN